MAALIASERHLRLNLSNIMEKDNFFLLDALLSPPGLFGDAVNSIIERFQEAKKQAATFQQYLPHHSQVLGAAGREQPQLETSSSHWAQEKQSVASRAPLQKVWGLGKRSSLTRGRRI